MITVARGIKMILRRFWRWLTLADTPTARSRPACDDCDEPAIVFHSARVYPPGDVVNTKFCQAHSRLWRNIPE